MLPHPLFGQVCLKPPLDLRQHRLQAVRSPAEIIAHIDGGEEVPGGFRGKEVAQIDGHGDDHRLPAVPHPHPVMNRAQENRRHQLCQRSVPFTRTGQGLVQGHPALQYGHLPPGEAFSPKLVGGRRKPGKAV